MIKCLIFDCDGTLVDSEALCSVALEHEFGRYDIAYPADQMMRTYRGVKLDRILDTIANQHGVALHDDFEANYRERLNVLFEDQLKACDGAHNAAEHIAKLGLAMCVASSGPITKMQKSLGLTGLASHFDGRLFSSYDLGVWKPEPDIFLHAAQSMGYLPEQCLVVEDSPVGVTAAIAANMLCVHYQAHGISQTRAPYTITHLSELIPLLNRLLDGHNRGEKP